MVLTGTSNPGEFPQLPESSQFPSLLHSVSFSCLLFRSSSVAISCVSGVIALYTGVYFNVVPGRGEFSVLLHCRYLGPVSPYCCRLGPNPPALAKLQPCYCGLTSVLLLWCSFWLFSYDWSLSSLLLIKLKFFC